MFLNPKHVAKRETMIAKKANKQVPSKLGMVMLTMLSKT